MTAGQPTKYKASYCDEVKEHLAKGYTLASWAGTIGICRSTAYNWSETHPEFLDAINIGRAKGQLVWEKRLSDQAETGSGNTAAIIFGMKNLYQDDWSDRIINELTGKGGGPIKSESTVVNLTDDELARIAAGSRK